MVVLLAASPPGDPSVDLGGLLRGHVVHLAIREQKQERTGSLTVLQQAMGHASLAVSLGYLRNLEVPMLKVEDMPRLDM